MKKTNVAKLLSLSLAALICFTGCTQNASSSQTPTSSESQVSSQAPVSSETPTSSEATETTSKWGTATAPLSIAEVAEICKDFTDDDYSEQKGYVTGVVKTAPTKNKYGSYEFYLEGGDIEFQVYSAKLADGVAEPKVGDTIVVYGYFKKFYEKYEVAYISSLQDSPSIISVVAGSGSTTPDTPSDTTNWGTASDPLTVEEAVAAMSSFGDDEYSTSMGYMTGKVISKEFSTTHSNWTFGLECPSGVTYTSKIYGALLGTNVTEPNVGDTIVGYGYFEKYVSSSTGAVCYELAYHSASKTSPTIISVTPASGTTTPDTPDTPSDTNTNYGTQSAPLSISDARVLAAQLEQSDYNNKYYSTNIIYLTGKVKTISPNKTYYNITLTDDQNNTFDIYSGSINSDIDFPVVGDTVIASGYYCNFNGTYQLGYSNNVSATVLSTTHNTYDISLINEGNATVTGLPATSTSGTEITFNVTAPANYQIESVTGSGVSKVSDGTYKFVVTSSNEITISVVEEGETVATSVLMKHNITGTSSNMSAGDNDAEKFDLDPNVFSVTSDKNSANNQVGLNKDGTIRLYANTNGGNGTSLTITATGKTITKIIITFGSTVGTFTVNEKTGDASITTYDINSESVVIKNTTNGQNVQVWIKSIEIWYK